LESINISFYIKEDKHMNMMNFLKTRKSTREFKKKAITEADLTKVESLIGSINEELSGINMKVKLYEYGQHIYDSLKGLGGYAGVMIESPHYIAFDFSAKDEKTLLLSGYNMEKLVTGLNNMDLGTCWVSLNGVDKERKTVIFGDTSSDYEAILAFGYPKPKNPFIHEPFSERLGVEELVFKEKLGEPITMDELEMRGLGDLLFYIRFAPSRFNRQPWRFVVHDTQIDLFVVEEGGDNNLMDAGIVMYYCEELAKLQGIGTGWEINLDDVEIEGKKYRHIGSFKL
jgi:nitroreductase